MDPAYNEAVTRPQTLGENTANVLQDWLGWDETKSKDMLKKQNG